MAVKQYNAINDSKRLAELVKGLTPKQRLNIRSKIKQIAVKLAERDQIVYGSTSSSQYARAINPKDIDISAKDPKKAAQELQIALKNQGINRKIKAKYIPPIRKYIYEVGNVSYSPLTKSKQASSMQVGNQRLSSLRQEVLNLTRTIAEPSMWHRQQKDLARLKLIANKLKGEKKKEFIEAIGRLKFESIARQYLYSTAKYEKAKTQRIFIDLQKEKYKKYNLKGGSSYV